jgi:cell division protein FtsL
MKIIQNNYLLVSAFTLVTVLCIGGLIMTMIFDDHDTNKFSSENSGIISEQDKDIKQDYWTKKRMEEAKPEEMPTVNTFKDKLEKIVGVSLPIFIMFFIIFSFSFTLINSKRIKLIEKENKEIISELTKGGNKL